MTKQIVEPFRSYEWNKTYFNKDGKILVGVTLPGLQLAEYQPTILKLPQNYSDKYNYGSTKLDLRYISYPYRVK